MAEKLSGFQKMLKNKKAPKKGDKIKWDKDKIEKFSLKGDAKKKKFQKLDEYVKSRSKKKDE